MSKKKKLMWCHNCKQNVSPLKEKGSKGIVVICLSVLGIVGLFMGVIPGLFFLGIAFFYYVVGSFLENMNFELEKNVICPICKANNLTSQKQDDATGDPLIFGGNMNKF